MVKLPRKPLLLRWTAYTYNRSDAKLAITSEKTETKNAMITPAENKAHAKIFASSDVTIPEGIGL